MPNMRVDKNSMPAQEPGVRNKNFQEVALGYPEDVALDEAARCLRTGLPRAHRYPRLYKKDQRGRF